MILVDTSVIVARLEPRHLTNERRRIRVFADLDFEFVG